MTNEEFQSQQRERRCRQEREAAQRKSIEDCNRSQREQQARQAEASKQNFSKKLGRMGAIPSPFGPSVDWKAYRQGKQEYDARKRSIQPTNPVATSRYAPPRAASGSATKKGSGSALLLIAAIVAALIYFGSSSKTSTGSSGPAATAPVIYEWKAPSQTANPVPAAANDAVLQHEPPSTNATPERLFPDSASSPQETTTPVPTPLAPNRIQSPDNRTTGGINEQPIEAALVSAYENYQTPWPTEGRQFFAEHKGLKGCKGSLFLGANQLIFTCPKDSSRSFSVPLRDIQGQDGEGIKLNTGAKYHFRLLLEKEQTLGVFTEWMHRARLSQGLEQ